MLSLDSDTQEHEEQGEQGEEVEEVEEWGELLPELWETGRGGWVVWEAAREGCLGSCCCQTPVSHLHHLINQTGEQGSLFTFQF